MYVLNFSPFALLNSDFFLSNSHFESYNKWKNASLCESRAEFLVYRYVGRFLCVGLIHDR